MTFARLHYIINNFNQIVKNKRNIAGHEGFGPPTCGFLQTFFNICKSPTRYLAASMAHG